jgi:YaaC-like Protein
MARLPISRTGEPLRVRGLPIPFSFWPAKKTTRWKLQRRLYVRDPWAILNEAVYRSKGLAAKNRDEALSYIDQAEEYFNAGMQGGRLAVKPVLLYYSILNLAKCLIKSRRPNLDMSRARHGLSVSHKGDWAVLGDRITVKSSTAYVNVFGDLMQELEGHSPKFEEIAVRDVLPQILPGHRLWTYASHQNEKFLAVDVEPYANLERGSAWLRLKFDRGEYQHILSSVQDLVSNAHLPGSGGRWPNSPRK